MKQINFAHLGLYVALIVLAATDCQKSEECIGETVKCQHKIYNHFVVCPDPKSGFTYSDVEFDLETIEMSSCDTSVWLTRTRQYDEQSKFQYPTDQHWKSFKEMYPNECGCE